MAEQERMTKAERREQKRKERLEEEARQAEVDKKQRARNAGIAVISVALIGGLVFLAVDNASGPTATGGVTITQAAGEEAQAAAGCEIVDDTAIEERTHYEPANVPPAETLYTSGRPTNSGSHYTRPNGVISGVANSQLDEYATTHNLEHGGVIVWFDPDQVDRGTIGDIGDWVERFNAAGFAQELSGAGLFASPYTDPGIDSGKALAVRAWGVSMDCDAWDQTAINKFVIDHYGTNGTSPEAGLGPYPFDALRYDDGSDAGSTGDGAGDEQDVDAGDMAPHDEG